MADIFILLKIHVQVSRIHTVHQVIGWSIM